MKALETEPHWGSDLEMKMAESMSLVLLMALMLALTMG